MSTDERIQSAIDEHRQRLKAIESKELWFRNSTTGRELKRLYEYTLSILEDIQKGE